MHEDAPWYRVFARNAESIPPAAVLADLVWGQAPLAGHFQADAQGWYRCELPLGPGKAPIAVECFRATEEGVRPEILSWAAFVETLDSPFSQEFMAILNSTAQVFTMQLPAPAVADLLRQLCRNVARAGDGVFQIDGEGFFWANGALALGEVP